MPFFLFTRLARCPHLSYVYTVSAGPTAFDAILPYESYERDTVGVAFTGADAGSGVNECSKFILGADASIPASRHLSSYMYLIFLPLAYLIPVLLPVSSYSYEIDLPLWSVMFLSLPRMSLSILVNPRESFIDLSCPRALYEYSIFSPSPYVIREMSPRCVLVILVLFPSISVLAFIWPLRSYS